MKYIYLSFSLALFGSIGSLYFSEILKFQPCVLCWYQRICLYPLVAILGMALWTDDRNYKKFAMPLIVTGLLIAGYHNLVYYGIIPQELTPCTEGISCSSKQLELFGFITIPLLSFVGFLSIGFLTFLDFRSSHEK